MRLVLLMIVLTAAALGSYSWSRTHARPTVLSTASAGSSNVYSGNDSQVSPTAVSPPHSNLRAASSARVDFATQVRPILEAKCQPCHFNGGKVYSQMPFDRPETIKTLGAKLFTRIKEENEQKVIREFLAQE